jgi:serine/threonine-protein kinase TTK/MPS1
MCFIHSQKIYCSLGHVSMKSDPPKNSSPLPNLATSRPSHLAHRRRDSDTLRNLQNGSPTVMSMNESRATTARRSPTNKAPVPANIAMKHRRSPTAPDPPTAGKVVAPSDSGAPIPKTWQAGERSSDGVDERDKAQEQEEARARQREQSKTPLPEDQALPQQGSPGDGHGSQVPSAMGVVDKRSHIFVRSICFRIASSSDFYSRLIKELMLV